MWRYNRQPYNGRRTERLDIPIRSAMGERMGGGLDMGMDLYTGHRLAEAVTGGALLIQGAPLNTRMREALDGSLTVGDYIEAGVSRMTGWGYNCQPYNRRRGKRLNAPLRAAMEERMGGGLSAGADFYTSHRLSETLTGGAVLCEGVSLHTALSAALEGSLTATTGVKVAAELRETLDGGAHMGADVYALRHHCAEQLMGSAYMAADVYIRASLSQALTGRAYMTADVYIKAALFENLNGYADAGHITEIITAIAGSLGPGGELIVDAENFTVLKDGASAIPLHSGDWIWVGRRTVSLTVSGTGSNRYTWEVLYTARYL